MKSFIQKVFVTLGFACIFFVPFLKTHAETVPVDTITTDTTWTADKSPYVLAGQLRVAAGVTLIIEPGVTVTSDFNFGSVSDTAGIILDGAKLIAHGTPDSKITTQHFTIQVSSGGTVDISNANIERISSGNGSGKVTLQSVAMGALNMQGHFDVVADSITANGESHYGSWAPIYIGTFATLVITNSTITNSSTTIDAAMRLRTSRVTATNVTVESVTMGILVSRSTVFTGNGIIVKNCPVAGIRLQAGPSGSDGNYLILSGSEIAQNAYGIEILNKPNLNVTGNSIHGNAVGIFYGGTLSFNAKSNWWGDASGPLHVTSSPNGLGDVVSEKIVVSPWLTGEPFSSRVTPAPTPTPSPDPEPAPPGEEEPTPEPEPDPEPEGEPAREPVIIIPGITGTRLIKNYDDHDEIWPNAAALIAGFGDNFLNDLSFDENGNEKPEFPMITGDIIRSSVGQHVFDKLITALLVDGYEEGRDLFVFPYDWRMPVADSAELLEDRINEIFLDTEKSKINIIAHSMGGLVAKKYIANNHSDHINNLIFIGTPHLGAPKAFKALMYGDDLGMSKMGFGLNANRLKIISQNMPAVYDLLPSQKYTDGMDGFKYVVNLVNPGENSPFLDYNDTKKFMIQEGRNPRLFTRSEELHASIDTLDLSGVNTHNFVGCVEQKTIGSIVVKKKMSWTLAGKKIEDDFDLHYINGDETVPLYSALGNYDGQQYYIKNSSHGTLPSTGGVPENIVGILKDAPMSQSFANISTEGNICGISGTEVGKHSPVIMHIYDNEGRHTGPTENGDIEYGIPGVSYDEIGNNAFAFLPDGKEYRVVNVATDTGGYDFYVRKISGDDSIISQTYFSEIPLINIGATSDMIISPSVEPVIRMDVEADGIFDSTHTPSAILSASEAEDRTPPVTESVVLENGVLTLNVFDDNAGVLRTEYSIDSGSSWLPFTAAFNAKGETVLYFSTDKAGNIEDIHTIVVPKETKIVSEVAIAPPVSVGGGGGGRSSLAPVVENGMPDPVSLVPQEENRVEPRSIVTIDAPERNGMLEEKDDRRELATNPPKSDYLQASASKSNFFTTPRMLVIGLLICVGLIYIAKKYK